MKEIACGDLVPGCHHKIHARTEAELMQKVSAHLHDAHPEVTLTPAMVASAKEKTREVS